MPSHSESIHAQQSQPHPLSSDCTPEFCASTAHAHTLLRVISTNRDVDRRAHLCAHGQRLHATSSVSPSQMRVEVTLMARCYAVGEPESAHSVSRLLMLETMCVKVHPPHVRDAAEILRRPQGPAARCCRLPHRPAGPGCSQIWVPISCCPGAPCMSSCQP